MNIIDLSIIYLARYFNSSPFGTSIVVATIVGGVTNSVMGFAAGFFLAQIISRLINSELHLDEEEIK